MDNTNNDGETVYGTPKSETEAIPTQSPDYKDKNWLYNEYVVLEKSFEKIADENGWASSTVEYWVNKHNIETRDMQKAVSIGKKDKAKYRNEDWLREMYIEREYSTRDLAEICDTNWQQINDWMERFNIEKRSRGEGVRVYNKNNKPDEKYTNESWLRNKYKHELLSTKEIGELVGVHRDTIERWLNKYDIETRAGHETIRARTDRKYPVTIRPDKNAVESDGDTIRLNYSWQDSSPGENVIYPLSEPDFLEKLYWEKNMSLYEIGDYIGCSHGVVQNRFDKYGIETRDLQEAKQVQKR